MSQISATFTATQALHPRPTSKAELDESLPKSGVALDPDEVFAELVMHHQDRAIRLALRLLSGDRAAAEDVVQEAYLRAHRGLSRFRGDARLTTWFDRIVVREAYRHHRRPWRRWLAGEEPQDHVQPERPSPPDPLLQDRIHASLERLTMHQRTVFVLMHLEGHTATEVAAIMGRSVGTVKSHLHRALKSLRADLADLASTAGKSHSAREGDDHGA